MTMKMTVTMMMLPTRAVHGSASLLQNRALLSGTRSFHTATATATAVTTRPKAGNALWNANRAIATHAVRLTPRRIVNAHGTPPSLIDTTHDHQCRCSSSTSSNVDTAGTKQQQQQETADTDQDDTAATATTTTPTVSSITPVDPPQAWTIPGAQKGGRKLAIVFTCTVCDTRSAKQFTENAYNNGVVLVRCPGCQNQHLIADRLDYFGEADWDIKKIMAEHGQQVKTVTGDDVLEMTLEDLVGKERMQQVLQSVGQEKQDDEQAATETNDEQQKEPSPKSSS